MQSLSVSGLVIGPKPQGFAQTEKGGEVLGPGQVGGEAPCSARRTGPARRHHQHDGAPIFRDRITQPWITGPDRRWHQRGGILKARSAASRQHRCGIDTNDRHSRRQLRRGKGLATPAQQARRAWWRGAGQNFEGPRWRAATDESAEAEYREDDFAP